MAKNTDFPHFNIKKRCLFEIYLVTLQDKSKWQQLFMEALSQY